MAIEIISEVKIQFDGTIWNIFTVAKNTLKINQMKRYYNKFNRLDLELCIWIWKRRVLNDPIYLELFAFCFVLFQVYLDKSLRWYLATPVSHQGKHSRSNETL